MNKYKININKPIPSDEVINQKKNFNELLGNFKEVHNPQKFGVDRHRKIKKIQIIVVVVAILLALYVANTNHEKSDKSSEKIETVISR